MEKSDFLDDRTMIRIVETYSDLLLRIALNRVRSVSQAEDIVQSVYVRLMTARPWFRSAGHERAWLIRTAVNLCLDYDKSAFRRTSVPLNEETVAALPPETGEVLDALRLLPERDRYTVYLFYYEDMSVRDIAKLLGERDGTVTSRLSRARRKLKTLLEGDGHGTVSSRI